MNKKISPFSQQAKKLASIANQTWRDRRRKTVNATVLKIWLDGGTKNITLAFEPGVMLDFTHSSGVGLPGNVDQKHMTELLDVIDWSEAPTKKEAVESFFAENGYPSIKSTNVTTDLLKYLDQKLDKEAGTVSEQHQRLKNYLNDPAKETELCNKYDLVSFCKIFPNKLTLREVLMYQGPDHGNKTYSLFDHDVTEIDGEKRQTISISVLPEGGVHKQDMFGENPAVNAKMLGPTSHYLYGLKTGDIIQINETPKNKKSFALVDDLSKPTIMIGQGNGAVPFVTMLKEMKKRQDKGDIVKPAHVILAAKDLDNLWGVQEFKPYLDAGLIGRVDIALSQSSKTASVENPAASLVHALGEKLAEKIHIHHGTRLVDDQKQTGLFAPELKKILQDDMTQSGCFYISSSKPFKNSIQNALFDLAKETSINSLKFVENQIKTTSSPTRLAGQDKGWTKRISGKQKGPVS